MNLDRAPEIQFAVESVRRAAGLVREVRAEFRAPAFTKKDRSPVTVADFAAQALIAKLLAESFPDDVLVAEEDSSRLRTPEGEKVLAQITGFVGRRLPGADPEKVLSWIDRGKGVPGRRFWVLDPIDGTKGFLRGDQYAVALALVTGGDVKISVLGCPNLRGAKIPEIGGEGTLAVAVRGRGSRHTPLDGKEQWMPLRVSGSKKPAEAVLLRSFENRGNDARQMETLARALGLKKPPVFMDSLAKYAVLAAGGGDLLFRVPPASSPAGGECIWDQAPGALIVEEAGGRVTDLDGRPLDYTAGRVLAKNRGVLISNGHLHAAALKAVKGLHEK